MSALGTCHTCALPFRLWPTGDVTLVLLPVVAACEGIVSKVVVENLAPQALLLLLQGDVLRHER